MLLEQKPEQLECVSIVTVNCYLAVKCALWLAVTPIWLPGPSVIAVSPFENQSLSNDVLSLANVSQEADSVSFSNTQFIVHTLKGKEGNSEQMNLTTQQPTSE